MLWQLVINGIAAGSVYALVALALVVVYKASEVANFAQGDMGMLSAFVAYVLLVSHGLPFPLALPAALGFAFLLGVVLEFALVRRAKHPSPLNLIILTLGFQLMLFGFAGWTWGAEGRRFPFPIAQADVVTIGPVVISRLDLAGILTALVLVSALFALFRFTRLGLAMRAAQQDPVAARANGIPVQRIRAISFGISSAVGAIAAMLLAPIATLDPTLMWDPLLKGFAAAVLGGFTTPAGAVAGGYILGLIESLFGAYVSLEFRSVVPFIVIVAVLCIRPAGLFGRHHARRV